VAVNQDSKKVYSHGAVLGLLWLSDQVAAFITVQLDHYSHGRTGSAAGPVVVLIAYLTGESARPPVLSSERLLCSSRISRANRLGRRSCRQNVCCAHRVSHGGIGSAAGPVVRTSVVLIAYLTGESARPPVLSSERLLRASRIACVFGGPPGPALDPWKASWCAARLASKAAEVSSNVMASVVTSSGFGASPAWKANGCREDWPSGRHSCPSCFCGEVFL